MGVFDGISDFFSGIGGTVSNVAKTVVSPFETIFNIGDKYVTAVGNKAGNIIDKTIEIPGKIIDGVSNIGGKVVDATGGILNKGFDLLTSPLTLILIGGGIFLFIMLMK